MRHANSMEKDSLEAIRMAEWVLRVLIDGYHWRQPCGKTRGRICWQITGS
jgi:hypothetical protein